MQEKLAWGILGTGNIAKTFATGVKGSQTGRLAAVGSRAQASADAFGDQFDIPARDRHASYEALLADSTVQAVYIATPHPLHAQWAIRAADAGKHLLVEKPIGLNAAEAMAIIEAAIANDVFLMEAFMYRCSPQTAKVVELIRGGAIGEVRMIQATFSFHWPRPWNAEHRLTSNALGGGGILDVGGYPISFARLIAGAALGKLFADPIDVKGAGHLSPAGTDDYAAAILKFDCDIIAQVSAGVQLQQDNVARVYGSDGWIHIPAPWVPAKEGGSTKIIVHRHDQKTPQEVTVESPAHLYAIEADTVAQFLAKRQASSPAMSWDDTMGNMRTLDAWRNQMHFVYDAEKSENYPPPLASSRKASPKMKYGSIAGVNKKLSRLVMGCDNQTTFPHAAAMFDDFFSRGGRTFDTAWIYGGGTMERLLGQWIKRRNVRDDVAVIVKGAHSPLCTPRDLSRQLKESLDRLQFDHADIYIMHRDNPDIPVGEFVDVLNEHKSAGLIRAFGGSNWQLSRVQEANDYAAKNGKTGFAAVSNNFSLARMIDPVWAGCIAASDPDSRAWFTKTQTPLLAWSSQARGFFLPGRAAPDKTDDKELVRCWYSDDNFQRLARVNEMAKKRNVLPINIALAYVLAQPFPTFALIGPRQLSETRTSFAALEIDLTPDEVRWLNLEA
jgi:predicted dehydrogenase/aryl-alcohol dehydrogenase-like predicted oxidoreductase